MSAQLRARGDDIGRASAEILRDTTPARLAAGTVGTQHPVHAGTMRFPPRWCADVVSG